MACVDVVGRVCSVVLEGEARRVAEAGGSEIGCPWRWTHLEQHLDGVRIAARRRVDERRDAELVLNVWIGLRAQQHVARVRRAVVTLRRCGRVRGVAH